jgi:hypothetical protein
MVLWARYALTALSAWAEVTFARLVTGRGVSVDAAAAFDILTARVERKTPDPVPVFADPAFALFTAVRPPFTV